MKTSDCDSVIGRKAEKGAAKRMLNSDAVAQRAFTSPGETKGSHRSVFGSFHPCRIVSHLS